MHRRVGIIDLVQGRRSTCGLPQQRGAVNLTVSHAALALIQLSDA